MVAASSISSLLDRVRQDHLDLLRMPSTPKMSLAVVSCMDCRIHVHRVLGVSEGDVNVIRNAGALVTEDTLRSLATSQHILGTQGILLMAHKTCALIDVAPDVFLDDIENKTGTRPSWSFPHFSSADEIVRYGLNAILSCDYLPYRNNVAGVVLDMTSGVLDRIKP
jgi:carbonic anhydrase